MFTSQMISQTILMAHRNTDTKTTKKQIVFDDIKHQAILEPQFTKRKKLKKKNENRNKQRR